MRLPQESKRTMHLYWACVHQRDLYLYVLPQRGYVNTAHFHYMPVAFRAFVRG